jgi:AbrB family looped-hinge helix DNA binding protein
MKLKVRVGPKGQIVIPKSVRDTLGIKPNDFVLVDADGGKATLETVQVNPLQVLAEIAQLHGVKSSELLWGDKLYEEVLAGGS